MDIYTIKKGTMKPIPEDQELKQIVKYCILFWFGYVIHWVQTALQG